MQRLLSTLCLALATQLAHAGVINFDDLGLGNFDPIANNYADHGLNGNGDARVGVRYSGSDGADDHLVFWYDNYGPLLNVAFTPTDGTMAEITLTADAGWLIQSIAFELAAWPTVDLDVWPAVDVGADVYYSIGGVNVAAPGTTILGKTAPYFNLFSLTNLAGATVASMRWGTDWDVGIDNINFTVIRDPSVPLPAPGTLALVALGLGAASLRWGGARRAVNRG